MDDLNSGNNNHQVSDPIINFDLGSKQITVARLGKLDLNKYVAKLTITHESFSDKKFTLEQLVKFRDELKSKKTTCVEDALMANQLIPTFKNKFTMEEFTEEPTKVNIIPLLKLVDAEVLIQKETLAEIEKQAAEIADHDGKEVALSISIDRDEVLQILGEILTRLNEQLTSIIEYVYMVFFTTCEEGAPLTTANISTALLSDLSEIRIALPAMSSDHSVAEEALMSAIKALNVSSRNPSILALRNMLVSNITPELQDPVTHNPGAFVLSNGYDLSHPERSQINTLKDYATFIRDENLFNRVSDLKVDGNPYWYILPTATALALRELVGVLSSLSVIVDILKTIND